MSKGYTSNSLQKIISKLMDKKLRIINEISENSTFTASISEDLKTLAEENVLNLQDSINRIEFINSTILRIKHAKNQFNTTYMLPINKMTIDEAIIELAMLNEMKSKLGMLAKNKVKERCVRTGSKEPEYTYITYDKDYAEKTYDNVFDKIQSIQEELNDVNSNVMIKVDIDEDAISRL